MPLLARAQEREVSPATVNPVLRSALRQTISLDGPWEFATDPTGIGEKQRWFAPETALPNKILLRVPGCWEAAEVGGVGNSTSVTPERSIRPIRGAYAGTAWYRKELAIPNSWAGKQVWLKFGGVNAQGWFWVNGIYVGHDQSYCGSYKYNITDLVKPGGKIVIAAKVRNDVPSGKGLMNWIERFGGLYRSVELEATPDLLIDDVYVEGDFDRRKALVNVQLRAIGPIPDGAELQVSIATMGGTPAGRGKLAVKADAAAVSRISVPVSLEPFRPWSPEQPDLYRTEIVLSVGGRKIDGWVERFGVRKWEARGGDFYLNNRRYFIRGFGDDFIYPLTIVSPASRETHKRHLTQAKVYGFNYVRLHTHCELPEFYEAADERGIMVQPELPYYAATPSAGATNSFRPAQDLEELFTHYRRYVSLATYCGGNEGYMGSPMDQELYQLAKRLDPSRLLLHQDGGENRKNNSDFYQGPVIPWEAGTQDASRPFTAHEYLNLATEEDPRLAVNYGGAMLPPVTMKAFRGQLAKTGLSWEWGVATLEAGNQLQRIYQKRGLEQARLDPACDGYIYWTIVDVGSPSAQGLFNQFWEPKASTPDFFRQFNSPTVLLAKFSNPERILKAGEDLKVEWWISAFGARIPRGQKLIWQLQASGEVVDSGELGPVNADAGDVKALGSTAIKAPNLAKPAKLRLTATLAGADVKNSWDLWVFPRETGLRDDGKGIVVSTRLYRALKKRYPGMAEANDTTGPEARLLLTDQMDKNTTAWLEQGKSVLLLGLPGIAPGVQLGWWRISEQAGTAIARHPAFGDFPHDGYLDESLFRSLDRTIDLADEAFRNMEPLMVGRGSAGYLAHVFQANAGQGKLLACGFDLLTENPEAVYLREQFIRYAQSAEFQPRGTFDPKNPGKRWSAFMTFGEKLNGWSETVRTSERERYPSFLGHYPMCIARQTDGKSEIVWQTRPVPANLDPTGSFTFRWIAGLGYLSEPQGKFTLSLGGQRLLELNATLRNKTWRSADGKMILSYAVESSDEVDGSGTMELNVPTSFLKPGESAELRVNGSPSKSRCWFGLYEAEFENQP